MLFLLNGSLWTFPKDYVDQNRSLIIDHATNSCWQSRCLGWEIPGERKTIMKASSVSTNRLVSMLSPPTSSSIDPPPIIAGTFDNKNTQTTTKTLEETKTRTHLKSDPRVEAFMPFVKMKLRTLWLYWPDYMEWYWTTFAWFFHQNFWWSVMISKLFLERDF